MKNFKLFSKNNKGYSLIVLIIAIIVILLLALVSIISLRSSREKTMATNFIYDLRAVEEAVRNYYTSKGSLPTSSNEAINIYELVAEKNIPGLLSQLSNEDDEIYYYIDLSRLSGISLKDTSRGYIVNNGSQNVYVTVPLEYTKSGEKEAHKYYTLTTDLVNGRDIYSATEEDVEVVGNPISWATKADLRIILPKRSLNETSWDGWDFRFSVGPKSQAEMEDGSARIIKYVYKGDSGDRLDTTNIIKFDYGDMITLKTNGTYTFYIKEPDDGNNPGKVTLKNVNVSKIDDINPKYEFSEGGKKFLAVDNETGIKEIRYKTLKNYINNKTESVNGIDDNKKARTNLDYFLLDGKGKDLIYEMKSEIESYKLQLKNINDAAIKENVEYDRYVGDHPEPTAEVTQEDLDREFARHTNVINNLKSTFADVNTEYAYLYDIDGETEESRLVVCLFDNADNALVVGESDFLSTRILSASYNIPLDGINEAIEKCKVSLGING